MSLSKSTVKKLIELKRRIQLETPGSRVTIATHADHLIGDCDLIVTATSAFGQRVIDITRCKPGAVVCDVARPPDISEAEAALRPDVLVIESGEVLIPGEVDLGYDIGLPPGTSYACLAETALLAMEGRFEDYTLGRQIEMDRVKEIYRLFKKHGFALAGLRSFGRYIDDADLEERRRLADDRVLPHVADVLEVHEHPSAAEAFLDEQAHDHVGTRLRAVRVHLEPLRPRVVDLEPDASDVLVLPHADQARAVPWCEGDVPACGVRRLPRADVRIGAGRDVRSGPHRRQHLRADVRRVLGPVEKGIAVVRSTSTGSDTREAKNVPVTDAGPIRRVRSADTLLPRSASSGPTTVSRVRPAASVSSVTGVAAKNPCPADTRLVHSHLGFELHEIPMLIAANLLKPLGKPARNCTKYFATETLEQLRRDEKWLARASDAIAAYWRERNARKRPAGGRNGGGSR